MERFPEKLINYTDIARGIGELVLDSVINGITTLADKLTEYRDGKITPST